MHLFFSHAPTVARKLFFCHTFACEPCKAWPKPDVEEFASLRVAGRMAWRSKEGHNTTSPWGRVSMWWLGSHQWLVSVPRLERAHHMGMRYSNGDYHIAQYLGSCVRGYVKWAETAKRSARRLRH